MRKLATLFLILMMLLSFAACTAEPEQSDTDETNSSQNETDTEKTETAKDDESSKTEDNNTREVVMLYPKAKEDELSEELFKNPTSEYRGAPFWAWNCELEEDELLRQIECLKEMGFGGFNMHARPGLVTEYLGKDFMELIKSCTDKAEEEGMLAWLYDEDYCPSGTAGGFVLENNAYRSKVLTFTVTPCASGTIEDLLKNSKPYLVACFDVSLNSDGTIKKYKKISEDDQATGTKWYVYMKTAERGYVDTLNKEAINQFIRITYARYKKFVGDKFGSTVPAIFTDEPQFAQNDTKKSSHDLEDVSVVWTHDFADTYKEAYGDDIIDYLPELVWELPNDAPSLARYRYHEHSCNRFNEAYSEQIGSWCEENGIILTGHVMGEDSLASQTKYVGEAMSSYDSFGIPGIDVLCNSVLLTTAKQAQSSVHQYGKEGMLSELYGVTKWTFDFSGHKFQGDWQAALGVTVRVPHLAWVSMKGVAKRDYPASISYQSPWYTEYSYIEDHYARLGTVLTRGEPCVKVGVIHPIESMWLSYGAQDIVSADCATMEANFKNVTQKLLFGLIDFDFISESQMPSLYATTSDSSLKIGEMNYDAIVVPNLRTIRSSTLKILTEFQNRGGKVIFIGECPSCVDGMISDDAQKLFERSLVTPNVSDELLEMLSSERIVNIIDANGSRTGNLIYNLREDNEDKYLFIANAVKSDKTINANPVTIILEGEYFPQIMDTMSGEIKDAEFTVADGKTEITYTLYKNDSLLLKLGKYAGEVGAAPQEDDNRTLSETLSFSSAVEIEREEPNVLVLDMAEYSLRGTNYKPCEEILRIDKMLRESLFNMKPVGGSFWKLRGELVQNYVYLRFTFQSEFEAECELAYEEAEEVYLNGVEVPVTDSGYYVDTGIRKMPLPKLKCGENTIVIKAPIARSVRVENYYLIGDFDVEVEGHSCKILPPTNQLSFGSIVNQGMPFYGGNIVYKLKINTPECDIKLKVSEYRGALLHIYVDGEDKGPLAFDPYIKEIENLSAGEHLIEIRFFGNRSNTFAALHNCDKSYRYYSPYAWYTEGEQWSYDYCFEDTGIMKSPIIEIYEKNQ